MAAANLPPIELRGVTKSYGSRPAVHALDLTVETGEMFGFLGPNGAGKTTTIRLLLDLLRPDSGQVRLLGGPPGPDRRARVGFVPDVARFDGGYRGEEWLDYLAALHPARLDRAYRDRLCERFELARADRWRPIKTYSRGMRQKLALVQALQHRPELVIMDEPTEGLDPLAKRALFSLLGEARAGGATVFFSSHILSEVERLCDRVALIRAGRLVAVNSIAALRDRQLRRIELALDEARLGPDGLAAFEASLLKTGGEFERDGERWRLKLRGELQPLLALLADLPVKDLVVQPADLEDIFLSYYQIK